MKKPGIKSFYQVYRFKNEPTIYIGVGPDKVALENPTPKIVDFISQLDGSHTLEELKKKFPKTEEWLDTLDKEHVIEDFAVKPDLDEYIAKRWSRQIYHMQLYERPGWSAYEAQKKLSKSRVVVVGAGAGGTTLLRFLSAVGIGTLEVLDFDTFSLENLPTHTTLDEEDIGSAKVESLRRHLFRQNSRLDFKIHNGKIESEDDLTKLIKGADFFCSAFDRPLGPSSLWTNRAPIKTGVPVSSIGATDKGARCGPIVIPGKTSCFECIGIEDVEFLHQSNTAALMGTMVAMLASIMVHEIVKVITGSTKSSLLGRSLYINTETMEFNYQKHPRKKNCFCSSYF